MAGQGRLWTLGVAALGAATLAAGFAVALAWSAHRLRTATVGSHEPRLMFATDASLLMTDATGAADVLADGGCRIAFVDARY